MNTKNVTDKLERKKLKRVARGSTKRKIRHQVQGQRKR